MGSNNGHNGNGGPFKVGITFDSTRPEDRKRRRKKEAISSTAHRGAQELKKSVTSGWPAIVKMKQTTTPITKAMTWFFVTAETQDAIAR